MRLTTKSRYGTRLILDLAVYGKDGPVRLSDVSKRQNISLKYLEQLTGKLKKRGFINTQRGPLGGHMLAKSPAKITIGDIVRTLEGSPSITDCSDEEVQSCGICGKAGSCLSRWVWIEASKAMFERLDTITIESLLAKTRPRSSLANKKK